MNLFWLSQIWHEIGISQLLYFNFFVSSHLHWLHWFTRLQDVLFKFVYSQNELLQFYEKKKIIEKFANENWKLKNFQTMHTRWETKQRKKQQRNEIHKRVTHFLIRINTVVAALLLLNANHVRILNDFFPSLIMSLSPKTLTSIKYI